MARKSADKTASVILAKTVAKLRDGYVCVRCGRGKSQGWQMHGAHIMPETWAATAADPDNILCLCASCHMRWHDNPIAIGRWFDEAYPGLYDRMNQKAVAYSKNPFPKLDWEEIRENLKRQVAEYTISV
jgi:hypothetical protein